MTFGPNTSLRLVASLSVVEAHAMSAPGHQFPGGFPGPQRSGFMAGQLTGMMNGQMTNTGGMVGMGSQMGQSYSPNMPNQMANMPGMPSQGMVVGNPAPSPNQGMGVMGGMMSTMGTNNNMAGSMTPTNVGSVMANTGIPPNMAISAPILSSGAMANSPSMQNTLNTGVIGTNTNTTISQNQNMNSQANQTVNQPQPNKEFNTASLCRFGQETVQDIVSRTQEVFQTLKAIQPPNGTSQGNNSSNDKKAKIQEQLRTIRLLFKRLRLIYEKCNENCQVPGMEYTHIESLIPLKEEYEHKTIDEKKTSEAYKVVCEENKELTEQVILKNKQLKDVINNLRTIIWEINVMLTMRRS